MNSTATLLDDNIFDEDNGLSEPHITTQLYGHEGVEAQLLKDIKAGRLPHAIILSGAAGIGKTTLAFRLARYLLSNKSEEISGGLFGDDLPEQESLFVEKENPTARRIASHGHADLKIIEPSFMSKEDKKLPTRIIRVHLAREIPEFLSKTSAEGGWRVVIVDEAQLMNHNAQNAILKILEEPPTKSVLILTTSEQGKLLPTIHSRCRLLPMSALSDDIMRKLLGKAGVKKKDCEELIKISGGRIGYALSIYDMGGLKVYKQMLDALRSMNEIDKRKFADKLGTKKEQEKYNLFMELLLEFLAKAAKNTAMGNDDVPESDILALHSKHQWFEMWQNIHDWYIKAEQRHLDKKAVTLNILTILEGKK